MIELISKEKVLKILNYNCSHAIEMDKDTYHLPIKTISSTAIKDIERLPTVESRPKGKWLTKTDRVWVVCSNCGKAVGGLAWTYPYCPYCGAEMEGMEREE